MEVEAAGRMLAACSVIAIVLYALRGLARALGRASASSASGGKLVSVIETTMLPNAASLHVVRVAERYYLIGRSAAQVSTLCELPPESIAATRAPPRVARRPFSSCIARLRASRS